MTSFRDKHDAYLAGQYDAPPLPEEPERPSWEDVTYLLRRAWFDLFEASQQIKDETCSNICEALDRIADMDEPDVDAQDEIARANDALDKHRLELLATKQMRRGSAHDANLKRSGATLYHALELLEDVL